MHKSGPSLGPAKIIIGLWERRIRDKSVVGKGAVSRCGNQKGKGGVEQVSLLQERNIRLLECGLGVCRPEISVRLP